MRSGHIPSLCANSSDGVQWRVLLGSTRHWDSIRSVLPESSIRVIDYKRRITATDNGGWPIHQSVDAEKRQFKRLPSEVQVSRAEGIRASTLAALREWQPSLSLATGVEGADGKIFIEASKHLGIRTVVPTGARMFGGMYFAPDEFETLPDSEIRPEFQQAAQRFIQEYRSKPLPANWHVQFPLTVPAEDGRESLVMTGKLWAARTLRDPRSFEWDHLRAALMNRMPRTRDAYWNVKASAKGHLYDLDLQQLPQQPYVYYPLQYSPESSINSLAPYYVDQERAIDLLRHSLPSGMRIVVKEHPSAAGVRSRHLLQRLRRKSGVLVSHVKTDPRRLIENALLTVSVTGSAVAEAFLLGCPSIALAPCLPGQLSGVAEVTRGLESWASDASAVSDNDRVRAVARVLAVRQSANFCSPGLPEEPMLNPFNVEVYRHALLALLGAQ